VLRKINIKPEHKIRLKGDRRKGEKGYINPKYIRWKIYVRGPYCEINECIREHDEYFEGRKLPIDFQSHNFNAVNIWLNIFFLAFHIMAPHLFSSFFLYFLPKYPDLNQYKRNDTISLYPFLNIYCAYAPPCIYNICMYLCWILYAFIHNPHIKM